MAKTTKKKRKRRGPRWGPFEKASFPPGVAEARKAFKGDLEVYLNELYQVEVQWFDSPALDLTGLRWLSIKRRDRKVIHDWRELQAIKNAICGREYEAVELYPAESRLVDTSNQFHLFVFPKGVYVPFGYFYREVTEHESQGSKQRPFAPHVIPDDLMTPAQMAERECRPLPPEMEGITCDWGACHEDAVAERFSSTHGWLPVCERCKLSPAKGGNA